MIDRLIVLLATATVIAAGCGSSDSGEPSAEGAVTTSSLSKAEFIKQASAACIREGKKLPAEAAAYLKQHESETLPDGTTLANLIKTIVVPAIEAQRAAMHDLGAPVGDEEELEAIFAAQQEGIAQARQLQQAKSTEIVESYFARYNNKLEDYGFTACTYG